MEYACPRTTWAREKTGQFDDHSKFVNAVHQDNEEDLRDAADMSEKKKEESKKNYMPPD